MSDLHERATFKVCEYLRGKPCEHCKIGIAKTGFGAGTPICLGLAEETIDAVTKAFADEQIVCRIHRAKRGKK